MLPKTTILFPIFLKDDKFVAYFDTLFSRAFSGGCRHPGQRRADTIPDLSQKNQGVIEFSLIFQYSAMDPLG
jgi:hypothetical protein